MQTKDSRPMFLYISITRMILMTIASFGTFGYYWIYKNWKYLKEKDSLNIRPFWRGVFGVFYCHSLLKAVQNNADANKIQKASLPVFWLATGWVALTVISNVLVRTSASITVGLIGLVACLFLVPVQDYINDINQSSNSSASYSDWSVGQIICLVFGVICWLELFVQLYSYFQ